MTTEKIRVSASSIIRSDPEMSATPASVDCEGGGAVDIIGESVTFTNTRGLHPGSLRLITKARRNTKITKNDFVRKRSVSFVALRAFGKKVIECDAGWNNSRAQV